jgi:hypothetical protein
VLKGKRVIIVGQITLSNAVGTDTVDGQAYELHTELVLHTRSTSTTPSTHKSHWNFVAGVPNGWSGSTGWQIDGAGFSEVFIAC